MRRRTSGFTLVELLVVIGIIGLLIGILLPTLARARRASLVIECASNLHQCDVALSNYLLNSRGRIFWKDADAYDKGMDWFVWGGRESGNACLSQNGLFNLYQPRPLNAFVGSKLDIFKCPGDEPATSPWTSGISNFDWVGNSYTFNSGGNPQNAGRGLAGIRITEIHSSADVILFTEASVMYPGKWHDADKANICLSDGHVVYANKPTSANSEYKWF